MSTATSAPGPARTRRHARPPDAGPFTGTVLLLRLYLRVDRLRILIWVLGITLVFWLSVIALREAFPDQAALQVRAELVASPAARLLTGPGFGLDNYTFGALVANEMGLFTLVLVAIMGISLVTRHTRAEEESGRMEMVRALPVGPLAAPTAALLSVTIAQALAGAGVFASLLLGGLETFDSFIFALSLALTGLVFASAAAVTAQITEHARAASGLALAAFGAAFLVRGVGDTLDASGSWLSWLSPIAWAQQTRVYVDVRVWPLALSVGLTLALLGLAVALARRRDLGAGLRAPRPGPGGAARRLLSVPGMAHRLLRGGMAAWAIGLLVFGATIGAISGEIGDALADLPGMTDWVAIDLDQVNETFAAAMLAILMVGPIAQLVAAVLRWRTEDEAGRVSSLIIGGSERRRAYLGWLAVAAAHAIVSTLATGLGLGLGMAGALGEADWIWRAIMAAAALVPGLLVTGAVAALLVGLLPGRAGVAWLLVLWMVVVAWLGELLRLPDWAMNLSPLHASSSLPAESADPVVLIGLSVLAGVLTVAGVLGFARRDLLA